MGFVVDHTFKLRFTRPSYLGPILRWPPNPTGPEYEIRFADTRTATALKTRAALAASSSLARPFAGWPDAQRWRIESDKPPVNHPAYKGELGF